MHEIGGYFEMELPARRDWHAGATALNSGRNALRWFLRLRRVHTLWLPHYICDSVIAAARAEGVVLRFYHLEADWWPQADLPDGDGEWLLFVNYFGMLDGHVQTLAGAGNLLVDNAQAFYSTGFEAPAIYSPRKFFGVADGGYLVDPGGPAAPLPADRSWDRYAAALIRVEAPAEEGYRAYLRKEEAIGALPLRAMSELTGRILGGVDYDRARFLRERNFRVLHEMLEPLNRLTIDPKAVNGPQAYPLLCGREDLRRLLARQRIYVPTYWAEVGERVPPDSREADLARCLSPLPVDQRYELDDMRRIAHAVTALVETPAAETV